MNDLLMRIVLICALVDMGLLAVILIVHLIELFVDWVQCWRWRK